MKTLLPTLLFVSAGMTVHGQVILTNEHVDIGIGYAEGAWDLHVHDEENATEYAPSEVTLLVPDAAKTTIPANPAFAFLGAAGADLWLLPQGQDAALLFLGIGTEEIAGGVFDGNQVKLTLTGLSHAQGGRFTLYQTNQFGAPVIFMNSGDGLSAADAVTRQVGGHGHYHWTFSAPGEYALTFTASGTIGGTPTSDSATYTFLVIPEPASAALLATGAGGLFLRRSRRA